MYMNFPPVILFIFVLSILAKTESKWDTVTEQDSDNEVNVR